MGPARDESRAPFLGPSVLAGCVAAGLAVGTAIQCYVYEAGSFSHPLWMPPLLYGAVLWFWWTLIFILLWRAGRRWPRLWLISASNGALQLVIGTLVGIAHLEVLQAAVHIMILRWPRLGAIGYEQLVAFGIERLSLEILLYVIVWATCAAVRMQIVRQEEALQVAALQQQLSSAHLRALQMQLKPHFLFNTLNAVTTLVEFGRQKEAAETLSHLNAILRSTLAREVPEKVSVAQELEVIENYLAIEQIRFADRLRVEMSIDSRALDGMVPCFLLQPIIENAIRHGISQLEDEGLVRTCIERAGDLLHISVRDNGPGQSKSHQAGHGIGLRSTEDRLAHFYPRKYAFSSGQIESGGFEVSITIPYEPSPA